MEIYVVTVTHQHMRAFTKVYGSKEDAVKEFENLISYYTSVHEKFHEDDEYWSAFSEWDNAYTDEIKVVKSFKYRKDPRPNFAPDCIDSCIIYLTKHEV